MKTQVVLLLALIVCASAYDPLKGFCKYNVEESAIYDLFGFSDTTNKQVTVSLQPNDEYPETSPPTMTFHLCNRQVPSCNAGPSPINSDLNFGTVKIWNTATGSYECKDLTSNNANATASFLNTANYSEGVVLTYPRTENNYMLVVKLSCDKSILLKDTVWTAKFKESLTSTDHTIILEGSSAAGCPAITLEQFLQFFEKYKPAFTVVFLLIGLLALTMGLQFFNVTIFFLTTLIVTIMSFAFISYATTSETSSTVKLITFSISLIFGIVIGYSAVRVQKLGFFALGTILGGVGAFFLYTFLLHFFTLSHATLMLFIVILSLLGGALAIWLWKDVIILATSCIGSYFTVRAISFYLRGFPNELKISEGLSTFDYRAYSYLVAMVIVAALGMIHQVKKKKKLDEEIDDYQLEPSIAQI